MELLITTKEELLAYLPINVSFHFNLVKPFLLHVQREEIIPLLSQAEFDNLVEHYQGSTPNADKQTLLETVQSALAPLAFERAIPHLNVQVSSSGIHISTNEDKKTAFQWQIDELRHSYLSIGYKALDQMLVYLEEKKAVFTDWAGSESFTELKGHFIQSAAEFNEIVHIEQSRRMFLYLKPIMARVEETYIAGITSHPLFEEIKAELKGTVSEANAKLLPFIRTAVAHLTIARAVTELSAKLDFRGLTQYDNTGSRETMHNRKAVELNMLTAFKTSHFEEGKSRLAELDDYLQANADAYPLFKSSDNYVDPATAEDTPLKWKSWLVKYLDLTMMK